MESEVISLPSLVDWGRTRREVRLQDVLVTAYRVVRPTEPRTEGVVNDFGKTRRPTVV
jgi:hypothetical protein